MYYTDEQFKALAPFAEEFRKAVNSNFARNPGDRALDEIRDIYMSATGSRNYPKSWGCTACIVRMLKDAGRLWLKDRDERAFLETQRKEEEAKRIAEEKARFEAEAEAARIAAEEEARREAEGKAREEAARRQAEIDAANEVAALAATQEDAGSKSGDQVGTESGEVPEISDVHEDPAPAPESAPSTTDPDKDTAKPAKASEKAPKPKTTKQ